MRGNHSGRPNRCGRARIRAVAITVGAVNIDRPAVDCRSCIGDNERSRIHGCSASLHIYRTPLKNAIPSLTPRYCTVSTPVGVVRPKMSAFPAMFGRFFSRATRRTLSPTDAVSGVPVRPPTMCERSCTSAQPQRYAHASRTRSAPNTGFIVSIVVVFFIVEVVWFNLALGGTAVWPSVNFKACPYRRASNM